MTASWACSHAYLPTPIMISSQTIRIYCSFLDQEKIGRIGYIDVSAEDPTKVIGLSPVPVLDVGQPGAFDENGVNPTSIVRNGDELWLYYQGWKKSPLIPYMVQTGLAISTDNGESFVRKSVEPVLPTSDLEPFSRSAGFVLKSGNMWSSWYNSTVRWLTHEGRELPWYVVRHAQSADGISWEPTGTTCLAPYDDDVHGISRPYVVQTGAGYQMWFSCRRKSNTYRLGYAESLDGKNWTIIHDRPLPDTSENGWDSQMICFGAPITNAKGQLLLFYNGNRYGETGVGAAILA